MNNWDWRVGMGPPERYDRHEEVLFTAEQYDNDFPPSNAIEFADWLRQILDKVPEQYRDSAYVELDSIGGYEGSHYATIKVAYRRPETDEEFGARVAEYEQALRQKEAFERAEFERLSQKFTPTPRS